MGFNINKIQYYFHILWKVFTVTFIAIVCYQIIKIIVGGSWLFEVGVMSMLIANTTLVVVLAFQFSELRKEFGKEIGSIKIEIGSLRGEMRGEIGNVRGEIGSLRTEIYKALADFSAEIRRDIHNLDKRVSRIEHHLKIKG